MSAEPAWFKSSYSDSEGGQCLEAAPHLLTIHLRDSKRRSSPRLAIATSAWAAFIRYASSIAT
ncbi:DUF397 domain-containing protein [Streptomyces sp. NPDC002537]